MRNKKAWSIDYYSTHCRISNWDGYSFSPNVSIDYNQVDKRIEVLQSTKEGHKEHCRKEIDRLQRQLEER